MTYSLSSNGIYSYMEDLKLYIAKKEGTQAAERMLTPLVYYINTGRACTPFIKALLSAGFNSIYTVLKKNKSISETIDLLKRKLKQD